MNRIFLGIILGLYVGASCWGNAFESLSTVASLGKGYATTASFEGIESLSKNPAGTATFQNHVIQSNYSDYFGMYNVASFGYQTEIDDSRMISLQIPVVTVGAIPKTIDSGGEAVQIGSFSDQQTGLSLGVATRLNSFVTVGTALHFMSHTIDQQSATGLTLDFGSIVTYSCFRFGASINNITLKEFSWENYTNESLPLTFNLGLSADLYDYSFYSDASLADGVAQFNGGVAWHLTEQFDVYAGLFDGTNTKQFTTGTTLHLTRASISYTSISNENLGLVHKMGITFRI